jgi:hypothetical protein
MPGMITKVTTSAPQKSQAIAYVEPILFGLSAMPTAFSLPSGLYRFVLSGSGAAQPGALSVSTRQISSSDVLRVATAGISLTFPDGTVMTAGNGSSTPGVASGGDINLQPSGGTPPNYNAIQGFGFPGGGALYLLIFKLG